MLKINKDFKGIKYSPLSCYELKEIIREKSKENCYELDLTDVYVGDVDKFIFKDNSMTESVFDGVVLSTKIIDVTGWDTSQITSFKYLFRGLPNLREIRGIDKWPVHNVKDVQDMFIGCNKLKTYPKWYFKIRDKQFKI